MIEMWIYRGLVGIAIPIISFGLIRWISSMDRLTDAVNGIKEYISSQDQKNKKYDDALLENSKAHKIIYDKLNNLEKDTVFIKTTIKGWKK